MRHLLLLVSLLALVACKEGTPAEGAVKVTISYEGFRPGCIQVTARDAESQQASPPAELDRKDELFEGTFTVAVFRAEGWGSELEVEALAFESRCPVKGEAVARRVLPVTVVDGKVEELKLELSARDEDRDGYVSREDQGSDCVDGNPDIHPGKTELCNQLDDNCDGQTNEGFQVGATCNAEGGCQGSLACTASGGVECVRRPNQWHVDADGDGQGKSGSTGVDACQQPAGHVGNDTDCNDGDRTIFKDAPELCDTKDNDCDNTPDDGLNVGGTCSGGGGCSGNRFCLADGGVGCTAPVPTFLYRDGDRDGFGARDAGQESFCTPPDGGYANTNTDCDDSNSQRFPGAPERCNSADDDCDNTPDEDLGVGDNCTPAGGCAGLKSCAEDGGVYCQVTTPPTLYYPDDDLDSYGRADAGTTSACGPPPTGYASQHNDCDDGNPFTHPEAPELCDSADNDCDGANEGAGVCPPTPAWSGRGLGDTTKVWESISLWGDGGVWVVGNNDRIAVKSPGQTSFTLKPTCSGDWFSVWADPQTGKAYLGGTGAKLATYEPSGNACATATIPNTDVQGLLGFNDTGALTLYGVGVDGNSGRRFTWDGATGGEVAGSGVSEPLRDVHGLSPEVLFAVGGKHPSGAIFRRDAGTGAWQAESIPSGGNNPLNGLWVVHPKLAYAVGNAGTVLRWDGTTWSSVSFTTTDNLLSVLAFGRNSVYVTTENGKIFRYNGTTWTAEVSGFGLPLTDIAGTSPADIWAVGGGGTLFHWPTPPYP